MSAVHGGRERRDRLLAVSVVFNLAVLFGVAYASQDGVGGPADPGARAPGERARGDGRPPREGGPWRGEGERPVRAWMERRAAQARGADGDDGERRGRRGPDGPGGPAGPGGPGGVRGPGGPGGSGAGFMAGPGGGGPLMGIERVAERLDLNETQRQQLKQIHDDRIAQMQSIDERSREARRAMFEALTSGEASGAKLRELAEKELSVERERRMAQIDLFERFRTILTPEQRVQLRDEMRRFTPPGGPRPARGEGDDSRPERGPRGDRDGDPRPERGPRGERGGRPAPPPVD
ncbi:MAG: Spy/CpxP family protein refolding chaperone [Phycisphaeraceae bacterium]|nr:Spy/CpxP family protein refolding chaperone [Phycisphaeraceae bacterium]